MSLIDLVRRRVASTYPIPMAAAARPMMAVDDLRALVVARYRQDPNRCFKTLPAIEYMNRGDLWAMKVVDNVLSVAGAVLRENGLPGETIGDIRDGLAITFEELHHGMCHCIRGESMTGTEAARNFRPLADGKPTGLFG